MTSLSATDVTSASGIARVGFYRLGTYEVSANAAPYTASLSGTIGAYHLPRSGFSVTATDVDGNVGSSP